MGQVNSSDFEPSGPVDVAAGVRFYFYGDKSRLTYEQEIKCGDLASIRRSGYNPAFPLTILIHGYNNTFRGSFLQDVKNAFIRQGILTNVIMLDYEKFSRMGLFSFPTVFKLVPRIGNCVGDFIVFLIKNGFLSGPEQVQIIGESLGAQIAGFTGKSVYSSLSHKIQRITGLDPAGPIYQDEPDTRRLCSTDANFVDIAHCNMGELGFEGNLGHIDFYMNGGGPIQPQYKNDYDPGWLGLDRTDKSHAFATALYAESISGRKFPACGCYKGKKHCENDPDKCPNSIPFGHFTRPSARGEYYLKADSKTLV